MLKCDHLTSNDIYDYYPAQQSPVALLSIPHAGEVIPGIFNEFLTDDMKAMMEDVDYRVDQLIDIGQITAAGITVIVAKVHRYCVDLNRSPTQALLNWRENTKGVQIVKKDPDQAVSAQLMAKYYRPYYDCLETIITEIFNTTGRKVPVIDLHSMPSRPTAYHLKLNPNQSQERASFCLSDLPDHSSCVPSFINFVKKELTVGQYQAVINDPYQGGYVTKFINTFHTNNIQIEINRSIYMDEEKKELVSTLVNKLKPILTQALIKTLLLPEALE